MKKNLLNFCIILLGLFIISCNDSDDSPPSDVAATDSAAVREVWTTEQANEWYAKQPWLVGADYISSNAINQLEMWQAESYDSSLIDKELGYAEGIGMNTMRVYLHHLAWQLDPAGFKGRMENFLTIADRHQIRPLFVFFDDVWNDSYQAGKQPDPKPGTHNSGWIQDPGKLIFTDSTAVDSLEIYVKDVLNHFKTDDRVLMWDLYNEPGNSGYENKSLPLLEKVFHWGREVNPQQPLSAGVWSLPLKELNAYQLANSDVITYHQYGDEKEHKKWLDSFLLKTGKPLICTEYMARTRNSRFDNILPMLKEYKIGAINWGLVSGKSNTIYAWNTPIADGSEPKVWFHDIFRKDGTPYSEKEVALIKDLTGKQQ